MATLSIKNVPEDLAEKLQEQAKRNHRSLQEELLSIFEEAAKDQKLTVRELSKHVSKLGIKTGDDSARRIREMRDSR